MPKLKTLPLALLCACNGMGDPIGFPDTGEPGGEDSGQDWETYRELSDADAVLWGDAAGDYAGAAVTFVGDVTGDDNPDLLIGVPAHAKGAFTPGSAVVVPGPITGEATLSEVGWALPGSGTETAGTAVSGLGDINGDDLADFAIGAPYSAAGGVQRGAVYVFFGPLAEGGAPLDSADAVVQGASNYALGGWSVDGGADVNGDGFSDLLIGAKWQGGPGTAYAGAAYLFYDSPSGTTNLAEANHIFQGEAASDVAGHSVSMAGDVDGDGRSDLLVGAVWVSPDATREHAGGAYLLTASDLAKQPEGEHSLSTASAKLLGEDTDDLAGWDVAAAGDVNGDGKDDILITAPAHMESKTVDESGVTYVLFGPITGTVELADADAKLLGDQVLEWSGASVAGAGDQDGDGLDDVLIGSPYRSIGKNYLGGGAMLFTEVTAGDRALSTAKVELAGGLEYDSAGWAMDAGADFNGDGMPDMVIGASGADRGEDADIGSIHLVFGRLAGQ